jgi:hypothetical protein
MNNKILVPLGRYDRTEEMIPYVEKIARPGMKVIFMVPYQVDGIRWSTEESGLKAIEDGMRLAGYYAWDTNLEKAKGRISPALDVLRAKGIEVGVDLYAGNMRTALEDCAAKAMFI